MVTAADSEPFASFAGGLAVVTGGGGGLGRALCRQLASEGCSVALCDMSQEAMQETLAACEMDRTSDAKVTLHQCDVSDEAQVLAFAREVMEQHATSGRKVAVFNNAGFHARIQISGDRAAWERCVNVNWYGVYYMTRAFLPMLAESSHGYIVNVSSVCGFWAGVGFTRPRTRDYQVAFLDVGHAAYSAAKFAVRGFTEALMNDLKLSAPHVQAAVVVPGHIGTNIMANTMGAELTDAQIAEMRRDAAVRKRLLEGKRGSADFAKLEQTGILRQLMDDLSGKSDEQLRSLHKARLAAFAAGGTSAEEAAAIILTGMRQGKWRILVGPDAAWLDEAVRRYPEEAYAADFGMHVNRAATEQQERHQAVTQAAIPPARL